ncbi:hypothetical protein B9Z55_020499 [Caenorhabditis nigoni]|uniref:G-protein coupled receptors family 1 profile domain-containing protein n=1 Tax=Caenorhabditis nigoni TaxID=1611254 RepID=A0A2G5TN31_9PELO|nr:hypothetical protein B9Z55_020499 [Caenorhabditis nigoni]
MYIGWVHHNIPKVFGCLAFVVNPIFVYLVFTGKSICLGNYRFLLLYFAIFNVGISGYRYCFYLILTDGFFEKASSFNHYILTARCSMLACSYAILISHFVFRYLVILRSKLISTGFHRFMAASFALCIFYYAFFQYVCEKWLSTSDTVKVYIEEHLQEEYGVDPNDYNMLSTIYNESNPQEIFRSWTGVVLLMLMSVGSISVYFILGYKTMKKLNDAQAHVTMSADTAMLQRKLLIALTVQTVIPICISFTPSLIAWFAPVFNFSMGRVYNYSGTIALSAFPFLDPVAIIIFLPILRNRLYQAKQSGEQTGTVSIELRTV